jgi:hypothetical protein
MNIVDLTITPGKAMTMFTDITQLCIRSADCGQKRREFGVKKERNQVSASILRFKSDLTNSTPFLT